jgi:hypothetical protein
MYRESATAAREIHHFTGLFPALPAWEKSRVELDYLRARLAYARRFKGISAFCLFVGYPRSGHSIVGALLNAHRDAVISHQLIASDHILRGCSRNELYARIIARAAWFHRNGNRGNYPFAVPNQWQGRFASLKVIGDKRGGAVSRAIAAHPDFLARTRSLAGVPVKLIHVVRNPYDNIAAIARWNRLSLEESVEFYFRHADVTLELMRTPGAGDMTTLRHEDLIRAPHAVLSDLCAFLGLACYPGYLDDCASAVFPAPTYSRRQAAWETGTIRDVERRIKRYPFLEGYVFGLDAPVADTPAGIGT